jgi:hypothetical protein
MSPPQQPLSVEALEALRMMPVHIDRDGMLPLDAPDPAVINRLLALGLIVEITNGGRRYATTTAGQAVLKRFPAKPA